MQEGLKKRKERSMDMKRLAFLFVTGILALGLSAPAFSAEKGKSAVKGMSKEDLIKTAKSAAPAHISDNATIMIPGDDGKLMEVKKGTNGFTCVPDLDGQEEPDPMCADGAAWQWAQDFMEGKPKPTNTEPGIGYMASGGWHWEKDGQIVIDRTTPGAKRVKEPPHWMIFWPFEQGKTMLPSTPDKFGTYIMFEGTPYTHLMIYQDPKKMKGR